MHSGNDPAIVTVGLSMGTVQTAIEKVMSTVDEVFTRTLHLARLAALALPVVIFSFWIFEVHLHEWLFRLGVVYGLIGMMGIVAMPEQMYTGLGLGSLQWVFELIYPESVFRPSGMLGAAESGISLPHRAGNLDRIKVRMRVHGTGRFLALASDGPWVVPTDQPGFAATFVMHQVLEKGKQVPDTYTLRVSDETSEWNGAFVSFQAINHLRYGGWVQLVRESRWACPYKIVQDSGCPAGSCKLLNAWTGIPPPTSRYCTGFYMAERWAGHRVYLGHAADRDAALLDLIEIRTTNKLLDIAPGEPQPDGTH